MLRMGQGEDSNAFRFISWNEFYYDMLAKGEVIGNFVLLCEVVSCAHVY